jgi:hypothetical protein
MRAGWGAWHRRRARRLAAPQRCRPFDAADLALPGRADDFAGQLGSDQAARHGAGILHVEDLFVPEAFTGTPEDPSLRREPGPLYAFPQQTLYSVGIAPTGPTRPHGSTRSSRATPSSAASAISTPSRVAGNSSRLSHGSRIGAAGTRKPQDAVGQSA